MNNISFMQKATEVAAANGEVFKSIFDVSVAATQQWAALNSEFARSLAREPAIPVSGAQVSEQLDAYTRRLERSGEYLREVSDLCIKSQIEVARLHAQGVGEIAHKLNAQFAEIARVNPMEAAGLGDRMKSSFGKMGTAYDEILTTARELTESSVAATLGVLKQQAPKEQPRSSAPAKKTA